jgi:DNA-binding sugar fermentation-stimulating protein
MEEKILLEKLKNAIERATKNVIMVNSYNNFRGITSTTGEEIHEYFEELEAFVKAMIYHEMLNEGIPMTDISMETEISNKKQGGKYFDFYIDNVICNGKPIECFIEVKTFATYRKEKEEQDIRSIVRTKRIYSDIEKLDTAARESKVKTIMIIVEQSHYVKDIYPVNIVIDELKNLLAKNKFSDDILFAIADNSRAEIISAGKIKGQKA